MSGEPSILSKYRSEPEPRKLRSGTQTEGIGDQFVSMLNLILANGDQIALPYAMLMKAEFNASTGITLKFSTEDVTITGYRLEDLYRAIIQHRAREVRETGRREMAITGKDESCPTVVSIRCLPVS